MTIWHYWENKTERATTAIKHTAEMQSRYPDLIRASKDATKVYDIGFKSSRSIEKQEMFVTVEDLDTVSAGAKYYIEGKTALLNFASYKKPGGMFIEGSKAQEECLCHASFLYNVLREFITSFYDWNNQHKNRALYLNRALYSPEILFNKEDVDFFCDVITCAAPNKKAAQKYQQVSDEENHEVLQSRIGFILDVAKENNVDVLVLGAYGCGVFGQNATEVAFIFKEFLNTTHKCFKKVVFAIPGGSDGNFDAFRKVFEN